jgi:glucosylceramidase
VNWRPARLPLRGRSTMATTRVPLILVALLASLPLRAEGWRIYETSRDNNHRLSEVAPAAAVSGPELSVDESVSFQRMEGFGGALTESSAWVLDQIDAGIRDRVVRAYYAPDGGIGYTLARTHINSCDFSLGMWSMDPVPGDAELKHFTLEPMRRWVLPLLHEAQVAAGPGRFRLLASPWSPPSWMKSNGKMTFGGKLKPEYRKAWADYLVRFAQEMEAQEHIPLWALTVHNEPQATQTWESCVFSAEDERDFIRDHLGPALQHAGLSGIRLYILDHNRDMVDEWTKTILSDPKAASYVAGTAIHWYVSGDFDSTSRAHRAFPDKDIIFTEGTNERGVAKGHWELGMWEHGEAYAHSMINDFRNWVSAWIDWNIVLDTNGGPNHVGNFCDAPVIIDTETGAVQYTAAYYYIGQFSRFVMPGAVRVGSSGGPVGTESVAFRNPDGGLVVVVLNTSAAAKPFSLRARGGQVSCLVPARSIQTYILAR